MSDDLPVAIKRPRVVLMADVRLYRDGVARALEGCPECEIVGTCSAASSSLDFVAKKRPDVVLLDAGAIQTPALVQAIIHVSPEVRVVAFAIADEEGDAIRCVEAGASGYVSREATIDDLVATILRITRGEFPCSPRVAALFARRISSLVLSRDVEDPMSKLTVREREIIRLIDDGLSNKEIARRLGIELSTVKNHVHHILDKTRATRRSQAAARVRVPWGSYDIERVPTRQ